MQPLVRPHTKIVNRPKSQRRIPLIEIPGFRRRRLTARGPCIGVGVSQVVPVVVAALDSGSELVAIEQPELHTHPAIQVRLGDLFISQLHEAKRFLIETHSEHLLLRIMRRIRQTTADEISDDSLRLRADEVVVHFVEMDRGQTIVREMPLNERGELVKAWPGGFFEEGLEEMF